MAQVGLVHTTRLVIDPVHDAVTGSTRGVNVHHVLDEGILKRLAVQGNITPEIIDWLTRMVASAENGGAELAVVSCSSLSPCVNEVRTRVGIPVIKVDEPMMQQAILNGYRIGLVMTNPTTEKPSRILFEEVSKRLDKKPLLVPKLCPEAFAKLNSGDSAGHDEEVVQAIDELLQETDLVMLAQISIARVKNRLADDVSGRVLSSLDFIGAEITEMLHSSQS
ncbi:MAG: aspartate/glutamate racemase family protein [Desulfocapsaceae bacterium]|nr:aspartate/glutamate racemase family protein [Desulfocapsaceae bacterium]